jgi:hypothetical protein
MKGISRTAWLIIILILLIAGVFVFGKTLGLPYGMGLY